MKHIITIIAMLLVAVAAQAQLLWQVTAPGNEAKPSYLFGTYHLMPGTIIDSVPGLPQAIAGTDTLFVEIVQDSINSASAKQLMLKAMMAPTDSTLSSLVSPAGYKIISQVIDKYYGSLGVGISTFEKLTPAGIGLQLQAMQTLPLLNKIDHTNLLDGAVERRARSLGKPAASLETVDLQVQLLFGQPLTEQAADLLEQCKHDVVIEQKLAQLTTAYRTGNLKKITEVMEDPDMGDTPEQMDRLIYSRNRRWVQRLAPAMRQGSVLVAVGAGHLPTEQGLIALLLAEGFRVQPVK